MFHLFDVNQDGFVSESDLKYVIRTMAGDSLTDEQVSTMISETLRQLQADDDGLVSQQAFVKVLPPSAFCLQCVRCMCA